jgi:hypothetical protein
VILGPRIWRGVLRHFPTNRIAREMRLDDSIYERSCLACQVSDERNGNLQPGEIRDLLIAARVVLQQDWDRQSWSIAMMSIYHLLKQSGRIPDVVFAPISMNNECSLWDLILERREQFTDNICTEYFI